MSEMYLVIFSLQFVPFSLSLILARDADSVIHLVAQARNQNVLYFTQINDSVSSILFP